MTDGNGWPPLHACIDERNISVTLGIAHKVCLGNKLYAPKENTVRRKRIWFMTGFSFFRKIFKFFSFFCKISFLTTLYIRRRKLWMCLLP